MARLSHAQSASFRVLIHQLLMHSDQGWNYQMKQYQHAL